MIVRDRQLYGMQKEVDNVLELLEGGARRDNQWVGFWLGQVEEPTFDEIIGLMLEILADKLSLVDKGQTAGEYLEGAGFPRGEVEKGEAWLRWVGSLSEEEAGELWS